MTCTVQFAPEAQVQLDAIEEYMAIASGFPATAAHFVDGIIAYCESFGTFPQRGTRRDDLLPGLRIIGYRKSVTVAFRVSADAHVVSVVGVFYAGQDYETSLSKQGN
jgi:plasmid stabilization system protein ParE